MGKGDKKTRRGKITMGSYGVSRLRKKVKPIVVVKKKPPTKAKAETTKSKTVTKAKPKTTAKKTTKAKK